MQCAGRALRTRRQLLTCRHTAERRTTAGLAHHVSAAWRQLRHTRRQPRGPAGMGGCAVLQGRTYRRRSHR
ncbi:UNVERIFIED_CONTAM: hypothetical protein GTU68_041003 [Idotea baltica]|nr:hypothetical protein [Idotea baltica]